MSYNLVVLFLVLFFFKEILIMAAELATFDGNLILDKKQSQTGSIFLVSVTNPEWDACGFFAVIRDHGYGESKDWDKWNIDYFEFLPGARSAFEEKS